MPTGSGGTGIGHTEGMFAPPVWVTAPGSGLDPYGVWTLIGLVVIGPLSFWLGYLLGRHHGEN